jgi:hypothetical protein
VKNRIRQTDRQTEERKMHHHLDRRVRLPSSKAKLLVCEAKQNMEMTKRKREQERYKCFWLFSREKNIRHRGDSYCISIT